MIYNVTRTDRNIDQAVDQLVGKPFGFIYKLRNGSIGSEPFVIYASSPEFNIDFDSQDYGLDAILNLDLMASSYTSARRPAALSGLYLLTTSPYNNSIIYS